MSEDRSGLQSIVTGSGRWCAHSAPAFLRAVWRHIGGVGGTNRSLSRHEIRTTIITSQRKESLTASHRWVGGENISTDERWVPTLTITVATERALVCAYIWFDRQDPQGSTSRRRSWVAMPLSPSNLLGRVDDKPNWCGRTRCRQKTSSERRSQAQLVTRPRRAPAVDPTLPPGFLRPPGCRHGTVASLL